MNAAPPIESTDGTAWRGALDADGRIRDDLPCHQCGYSLRGRRMDERCPECGVEIASSADPSHLRFAPEAWLARISAGLTLFMTGSIGALVVAMIEFGLSNAFGISMAAMTVTAVISLALQVVSVMGLLKVTAPDPRFPNDRLRTTVRVLAVFELVAGLLARGMLFVMMTFGGPIVLMLNATGMLERLIAAALWWTLGLHGERLARRVPDHRLARQSRMVGTGLACASLIMFSAILVATSSDVPEWVLIAAGLAWAAPNAIFSVWGIVLLVWFMRRVHEAQDFARRLGGR